MMRRRELITLLGGAAAWPLAARAQQAVRARRVVGILMNWAADGHEAQLRIAAFLQGLQELGWSVPHNLKIEYRWAAGDMDRLRRSAAELVELIPDVILVTGAAALGTMQQVNRSRTVPTLFANVTDPV